MQNIRKKSAKKYKGFTLVELIVVITILVILGTIAFLNLGGFSGSARDSARISHLTNLKQGLDLSMIKTGTYPIPESNIAITASGTTIGYQGFAKDQVGSIAKISPGGTLDPSDPTIFTTYLVNLSRTKMQAMVFLEDSTTKTTLAPAFRVPTALASSSSDYSKRYPSAIGDNLGIILGNSGTALNQPAQELLSVSFTGVDIIASTGGLYKAFVSTSNIISGTGTIFLSLLTNYDSSVGTYPGCDTKDIKLPNGQIWSACNVGATTAYNGVNQSLILVNSGVTGGPTLEQKKYMGGYYQWGRNKDVTSGSLTTGPLASDSTDNFITAPSNPFDWLTSRNDHLWGGSGTTAISGTFASQGSPIAMQGPCQRGYHVPTQKEWCDAMINISPITTTGANMICNSTWQDEITVNLIRITLKLPLSGFRYSSDGSFINQMIFGYYWASSPNNTNAYNAKFSATQVYPLNYTDRAIAFPVRCLKN